MPRDIDRLEEFNGEEPAAKVTIVQKGKRKREWERKQREIPGKTTVTYRNIPVALKEEIKEIANQLHVNIDDIARAFLEQGLQDYLNGELQLNPTPKSGRFGLYAKDE